MDDDVKWGKINNKDNIKIEKTHMRIRWGYWKKKLIQIKGKGKYNDGKKNR